METFDYNFNKLFIATKGQPVNYQGKTLLLADRIPAKLGEVFCLTIEETNSSHPQGVGCSEGVEVFGQKVKRAVVWEYYSLPPSERGRIRSRLPFTFAVACRNKRGYLSFYNMAETQGRQSWWHAGACMMAEEIPGGRRYRCNDFQLNDDFNDIVFSVVRK